MRLGKVAFCLVLLALGASCVDYEFVVPAKGTVCFTDFVTDKTIITYGYTPFRVSSLEEFNDNVGMLKGINLNKVAEHIGNIGRDQRRTLRLLQNKKVAFNQGSKYSFRWTKKW